MAHGAHMGGSASGVRGDEVALFLVFCSCTLPHPLYCISSTVCSLRAHKPHKYTACNAHQKRDEHRPRRHINDHVAAADGHARRSCQWHDGHSAHKTQRVNGGTDATAQPEPQARGATSTLNTCTCTPVSGLTSMQQVRTSTVHTSKAQELSSRVYARQQRGSVAWLAAWLVVWISYGSAARRWPP